MAGIEHSLFDLSALDTLAYQDSPIYRLDARAKVLTVLVFVVVVASYDKYAVLVLLPLLVFPVSLLIMARLPVAFLLKRLALVAPFALLVGMFNPLFDQQVQLQLGGLAISGGWLSFLSILLRFSLTIGSVLVLIAVTSFPAICHALGRLGVPWTFVLQLLFLYRYIFVLGAEAERMVRARSLRSFHGRGNGLKIYAALLTQLLWRTLERARRLYRAMLSRCFSGRFRLLSTSRFGRKELLFVVGWSGYFILLRLVSDAAAVRSWLEGVF